MTWRAGATAGVNCSLCRPGSYSTGSGEGAQETLYLSILSPACVVCRHGRMATKGRGVILMVWYGVQAPLQMSTAACARQGRMGRDQVRAKVGLWPRNRLCHALVISILGKHAMSI